MINEAAPNAKTGALQAVSDKGAFKLCKRYFGNTGRDVFTGREFGLEYQFEPNIVTADHLTAVQRLSMKRNIFPKEQAAAFAKIPRVFELLALISDAPLREMPNYLAHSVEHQGGDVACCEWGPPDALWQEMKRVNQFGGLVTRSKLLARMRPNLIPIFDGVVGTALGIRVDGKIQYSIWGTFQEVVSDDEIWSYLVYVRGRLFAELTGRKYLEGVTPLRVLDVILWMASR